MLEGKKVKLPYSSGQDENCQFSPVRHAQVSIETLAANRNKSPRCTGALAASARESERWNSVTSFLRGGSNFFSSFFFFTGKVEEERERAALQTTGAPRQPAWPSDSPR